MHYYVFVAKWPPGVGTSVPDFRFHDFPRDKRIHRLSIVFPRQQTFMGNGIITETGDIMSAPHTLIKHMFGCICLWRNIKFRIFNNIPADMQTWDQTTGHCHLPCYLMYMFLQLAQRGWRNGRGTKQERGRRHHVDLRGTKWGGVALILTLPVKWFLGYHCSLMQTFTCSQKKKTQTDRNACA